MLYFNTNVGATLKQRLPSDRPAAVQGAKRRSGPLTARTDLESFRARERGIQEEALKQGPAPTPATGKSMSVATAGIP